MKSFNSCLTIVRMRRGNCYTAGKKSNQLHDVKLIQVWKQYESFATGYRNNTKNKKQLLRYKINLDLSSIFD